MGGSKSTHFVFCFHFYLVWVLFTFMSPSPVPFVLWVLLASFWFITVPFLFHFYSLLFHSSSVLFHLRSIYVPRAWSLVPGLLPPPTLSPHPVAPPRQPTSPQPRPSAWGPGPGNILVNGASMQQKTHKWNGTVHKWNLNSDMYAVISYPIKLSTSTAKFN
jgi:hypothetical protein